MLLMSLVYDASAQDRIYFRDAAPVEAVVKEIGDDYVLYKQWNNQSGPDYRASLSRVDRIVFANGSETVFRNGHGVSDAEDLMLSGAVIPGRLDYRHGRYYVGLSVVTPEKMIHLICYAEIGENRIPKKIIRFTFQDITPILGFNPQTGDFTADEKPIRAQFILFMKVLEGFLTASSYADAHSIKYTDRYSDRRLMSSIGAIASKLGVAAPSAPFYNNTVSGVNVQNGGNYQQPNGTSGVPVSEVSDLSAMFSDSPFA